MYAYVSFIFIIKNLIFSALRANTENVYDLLCVFGRLIYIKKEEKKTQHQKHLNGIP